MKRKPEYKNTDLYQKLTLQGSDEEGQFQFNNILF